MKILANICISIALSACSAHDSYKCTRDFKSKNIISIYISSDFQPNDIITMRTHISTFSHENNIDVVYDENKDGMYKSQINIERGGGDAVSFSTIGNEIKSYSRSFAKYGRCDTHINREGDHILSTVIIRNVGIMTDDKESFIYACIAPSLSDIQFQLNNARH